MLVGAARADQAPSLEELAAAVQRLVQENAALKARVEELEQRVESQVPSQDAMAVVPSGEPVVASAAAGGSTVHVSLDDGLEFTTEDGRFSADIGGRLMFDAAAFDRPSEAEFLGKDTADGDAEIRRAWLDVSGTLYADYDYQLAVDFSGDTATIKKAHIIFPELSRVGRIQVGYFKPPFGLEQLGSSNYLTFMERSIVSDSLGPDRAVGIGVSNMFFDKRMTFSAAVLRGEGEDGEAFPEYGVRLTGLPWMAEGEDRYIHVGLAYLFANPDTDFRFRVRPETHLADRYLDTGDSAVDRADRYGLEGAFVWGPFSLQGEYQRVDLEPVQPAWTYSLQDIRRYMTDTRTVDGYYVQASYFLTGEHRPYKKSDGLFGRVRPARDVDWANKGWGAWEVALRLSELDLQDCSGWPYLLGGSERDLTVGVNWYMTAHTRVMLNQVWADFDDIGVDDTMRILQARVQIDF